jgi:tetratricopeptide (TPR) repeat protein
MSIRKTDIGVKLLEHAVAIDPLCHQCRRVLTQALLYRGEAGDYRRALDQREQYMAAASGGQPYYSMLLLLEDRAADLAAVWDAGDNPDNYQELSYLAMADQSLGRYDEAEKKLRRIEELYAALPASAAGTETEHKIRYTIANVAAWLGDADKAFAHLMPPPERIRRQDRYEVFNPVWREIRDDPRWLEYREAIGMSPERLAAIDFDPWFPE